MLCRSWRLWSLMMLWPWMRTTSGIGLVATIDWRCLKEVSAAFDHQEPKRETVENCWFVGRWGGLNLCGLGPRSQSECNACCVRSTCSHDVDIIYIYANPPRTPAHVEQTVVLPALGLCISQLMCLQKAMLVKWSKLYIDMLATS